MLNKKEIKDIQSLADKKHRVETGLFVAEGPKIVRELIELIPDRIERVYALPAWIENQGALLQDVDLIPVTWQELDRISHLQTANQVLAVCRQLPHKLPEPGSFVLYLDTIQDPGNFGTIIRIADWFGIGSVVCTKGCADLYNPKVVQSTMASIARVNVFYDDDLYWLSGQKAGIYAAVLNGRSIYDHAPVKEGVLLIGNESKGLNPELSSLATELITIPRKGGAESLNAAVATGIILSHLII